MRLVPLDAQRKGELVRLIDNTTRAVVFGTGPTALVQGALVGIGFAMACLPSAALFGALAALLALLPIGGAALVCVPGALFLAADSGWAWAIFMLIRGLGVSVSDNLLRPLLISSQAPVSMLAVLVRAIGGLSASGVIGLIIGPVLLTVLVTFLGFVADHLSDQA